MGDANSPSPTFDADGYPTEETERLIANWSHLDPVGWIEFVKQAWHHRYGSMSSKGDFLHLVTGGWGGNEAIVRAMRDNHVLWSMLWESSHRGGLEVLRIPETQSQPEAMVSTESVERVLCSPFSH